MNLSTAERPLAETGQIACEGRGWGLIEPHNSRPTIILSELITCVARVSDRRIFPRCCSV